MTKSYIEECLERAENTVDVPCIVSFRDDIKELSRRLQLAINALREAANALNGWTEKDRADPFVKNLFDLADKLETFPEKK